MSNNIVVTLYYADWCPYCQRMKPVWNRVKSENQTPWMIFREVDGDVQDTPGISGYPTVRAVVSGVTYQYPGGADYNKLSSWIQRLW